MSTRATICIKEKDEQDIWVYHHCDGYPDDVGSDLKKYLKTLKYGWIAYEIANDLIKDRVNLKDDGYELTSGQHGDEEYAYLINCDDQTIKCYKIGYDQFEWKSKDEVEIPD